MLPTLRFPRLDLLPLSLIQWRPRHWILRQWLNRGDDVFLSLAVVVRRLV
jgi:hypothetical protein